MWKVEKQKPFDFNRSTMYSSDKNLKAQFEFNNQKRHIQDIKNQTSFTYQMDKSRFDKSLVMAPLRQTKIENYIIQHNNTTKQRETIFSTPTITEKTSKYKPLDSKKHYSNQYASNNVHMSQNPNYCNLNYDVTKTSKQTPNVKNQSSVGNPITFQGDKTKEDPNLHPKKKGEFTKDIYAVHGNFRPADREKGIQKNTNSDWINSQTRSKSNQVLPISKNLVKTGSSQKLRDMQSSIFHNENTTGLNFQANVYRNNPKIDDMTKKVMKQMNRSAAKK